MTGGAKGTLYCTSQANGNTIKTSIDNVIASRNDVSAAEQTMVVSSFRGWRVVFEVYLTTRASADQVADAVVQRWTTGPLAPLILAGSTVWVWDDQQDEGVGAAQSVIIRTK